MPPCTYGPTCACMCPPVSTTHASVYTRPPGPVRRCVAMDLRATPLSLARRLEDGVTLRASNRDAVALEAVWHVLHAGRLHEGVVAVVADGLRRTAGARSASNMEYEDRRCPPHPRRSGSSDPVQRSRHLQRSSKSLPQWALNTILKRRWAESMLPMQDACGEAVFSESSHGRRQPKLPRDIRADNHAHPCKITQVEAASHCTGIDA